ncbi:hypothetical protein [Bacillus sp. PS06]|uniref:hypothetical protein n=1 Tax=Bacillus sp. PS06 TaxID=2764176 RepID=UPI001784BC1D|nr:hypothetical protein [Bacillus sp. PS06]MBD8068514.1 hypothetical protein [Bacillus sp. PS06]
MQVSRQELLQLIKDNGNKGIITINDVPYEITISADNNIRFTGTTWEWEKREVPSAHDDYTIVADDLVKIEDDFTPSLNNQNQFYFYKDINDFTLS